MKIAILYIGTGRYTVFWDAFHRSCRRYFIPDAEKRFFFFTDGGSGLSRPDATIVPLANPGWPMITARRFEYFSSIRADLKPFDFVFFFNGNVQFVRTIHAAEFLPSAEQGIVACTRMVPDPLRGADGFPFERNPASQAYIPYGTRKSYHQGGLMGGITPSFLELVEACRRMTEEDLARGIVPVWHDESVFNKYLLSHPYRELPQEYLYAPRVGRFWWRWNPRIKIVLRDKNQYRYGGHDWLRGISNHRCSVAGFCRQEILRITQALWK